MRLAFRVAVAARVWEGECDIGCGCGCGWGEGEGEVEGRELRSGDMICVVVCIYFWQGGVE